MSLSPSHRLLARAPPTVSPASTAAPATSRTLRAGEGRARLEPRPFLHPRTSSRLDTPRETLQINPAFSADCPYPGTICLIVEDCVLYAHRDILIFASPFFENLLCGDWRETQSTSTWPDDRGSIHRDCGLVSDDPAPVPDSMVCSAAPPEENTPTLGEAISERDSFGALYRPPPSPNDPSGPAFDSATRSDADESVSASFIEQLEAAQIELEPMDLVPTTGTKIKLEARIRLVEERAFAVQDMLCFCYPHLDCNVSWANVAELLSLSTKFLMPLLRKRCTDFLLTSAAGRPISAIKLAEDYTLTDIYREASRFLLDTLAHYSSEELAVLSENTLLKIERKRTFFLERLLKLGLVDLNRDYVTCAVSCPDPRGCARLVQEKWQSAWAAAFRYSCSPQPSIVYRSLRQLEPSLSSPALHLPQTNCQNHAKAFIAELFDRLFGLNARGPPNVCAASATSRSGRYFLWIDL